MNVRKSIRHAATALLLAVSVLSCGEKDVTPVKVAKISTAAETPLGPAKTSIFLSVEAEGAWSLELRYPSGEGDWASVTPLSGTGDKNSIILTVQENKEEASRSVDIVLLAQGGSPVLNILQSGKGGSANPGGGDQPVSGDVRSRAYSKWLELPATDENDGLAFFAHDMQGGDYYKTGGQRNWSFYYDYDNRVSRWVAYPLNKGLIGSGNRTEQWGYDPLLPAENQFAILNAYGNAQAYGVNNVDRGHQLPSADRLSYNANVSTFYATNMTPQNSAFNQNIWADLESGVRAAANSSDTLYVVTGCIVDPPLRMITDRGGRVVAMPSAYYKALLRSQPGSTVGFSGYMAVGFYLPNDGAIANRDYMDYIMSIDELEKKTGVDFFVNLTEKIPQSTADKVEAESPNNWWMDKMK